MTTAPVVPTGPSPNATGASGTAKTSGLAIASLIVSACTLLVWVVVAVVLGVWGYLVFVSVVNEAPQAAFDSVATAPPEPRRWPVRR